MIGLAVQKLSYLACGLGFVTGLCHRGKNLAQPPHGYCPWVWAAHVDQKTSWRSCIALGGTAKVNWQVRRSKTSEKYLKIVVKKYRKIVQYAP